MWEDEDINDEDKEKEDKFINLSEEHQKFIARLIGIFEHMNINKWKRNKLLKFNGNTMLMNLYYIEFEKGNYMVKRKAEVVNISNN